MKTIPSIFALAAVTLGGTALAQSYVPSSASNGPSDLFIAVFNPDTVNNPGPSLVQDLGIGQDAGDPNTIPQGGVLPVFDPTQPFSLQLDGSAANFTSQLAGATVFGVFGGNIINTSGVLTGETFVTTTNVSSPTAINSGVIAGRATTANYVDNFLSAANGGNGVTQLLKGAGNGQNWANQTGGSFGFPSASPTATIGSNLNFYTFTTTSDDNNASADVSQWAGHWNLSTTGLLTWTPDQGSPVPLPAAVWMLLSGLLGLGSIARPRRGSADAA